MQSNKQQHTHTHTETETNEERKIENEEKSDWRKRYKDWLGYHPKFSSSFCRFIRTIFFCMFRSICLSTRKTPKRESDEASRLLSNCLQKSRFIITEYHCKISFHYFQQHKSQNGTASNGQKSSNVLAVQQATGCVCIPMSWVYNHFFFNFCFVLKNQFFHFDGYEKGVWRESRLWSWRRWNRLQRDGVSRNPLPERLGRTPDASMYSTRLALWWRWRLWRQFGWDPLR